jgi:dipeptidyl aminopeptidase/acylaminoacyl peptidase
MPSPSKRISAFAIVATICFALAAAPMRAQDAASKARAAAVLDAMPQAKSISDVALSPDGKQVAYVVDGKLFVVGVAGGEPKPIEVDGNLPIRDVAWSPFNDALAFVGDLATGSPSARIFDFHLKSGDSKYVEVKGYVQNLRFSPLGNQLAYLFTEGLPRIAGPLQPMTPLAGEIGSEVYEQRIATLGRATPLLKLVTPADMYIYEYDWTPDGKSFVATAAHGSGDANWYVAHLYTIDAQSGEMRDIYAPKFQIADPRVSPDGKNVAFIEGLMSDEGSTGGDIYVVPVAGGAPRDITPDIHASPSAITWTDPGTILFAENVDGNSGFSFVQTEPGKILPMWNGEETARPESSQWFSSGPATRVDLETPKAATAIVRQSAKMPPEVWVGLIGGWKQITHVNDGLKPTWGEARNVHWMNGATRVQGWLLLPKDYSPDKKYPLVVTVHGGPSAACQNNWSSFGSASFSAAGYFALCPNPRGSYGQGEAFVRGNVKDFGGGDFQDIMAGIHALAKEYPIDTARLGIFGHSYGGYMTMWAETQTNRFAAAVAGAGLSDWLSYYGLNDIDEWMPPFFGASVYDDPAVYAKSDPMHFVKNVKTPTLIMVGDRDGEVPMEQSVEWWHALNALHVPTTLVVYPDEGHAIGKPADARDYRLRTLAWFDQWFSK